jgi:hypothetical protein
MTGLAARGRAATAGRVAECDKSTNSRSAQRAAAEGARWASAAYAPARGTPILKTRLGPSATIQSRRLQ